jgi:hypothetical protein
MNAILQTLHRACEHEGFVIQRNLVFERKRKVKVSSSNSRPRKFLSLVKRVNQTELFQSSHFLKGLWRWVLIADVGEGTESLSSTLKGRRRHSGLHQFESWPAI